MRRGRIRRATMEDRDALAEVMAASAAELSKGFYSAEQIPSVIAHIAVLDTMLVEDGTYFAIEDVFDAAPGGGGDGSPDGGERGEGSPGAPRMVACGGWSRRDKLYTGSAAAGTSALLVPGRDPARVRAMFVHPRAARRGFGQAILEASERDAWDEGFTTVELMATAPGVPLYLASGYQPGEPVDLILPDGCRVGCVRMSKPLTPPPLAPSTGG